MVVTNTPTAKDPIRLIISSTFGDLPEIRERFLAILNDYDFIKNDFYPDISLSDRVFESTPQAAAYVGIIGRRYGFVPPSTSFNPNGLSVSELEFNLALNRKLPIVVFIGRDDYGRSGDTSEEELQRVRDFRHRVRYIASQSTSTFCLVNTFTGSKDFEIIAKDSLNRLRSYFGRSTEDTTQPDLLEESGLSATRAEPQSKPQTIAPVAPDRPLVFISASHKDSEWRKLIEEALGHYHEAIDWWDDSRIRVGSDGAVETEAAIARAQIAVLLISPDYLNSANAVTEMIRLRNESMKGSLKLLPIVVRESAWQKVEAIRTIEVWGKGAPLDQLEPVDRRDEMNRIAASILELLEIRPRLAVEPRSTKDVEPNVDSSTLRFSEGARMVIEKARALADQSRRGRITSSCLLFGFAESAFRERNDSALLVRDLMVMTDQYQSAFEAFLSDAESSLRNELVESVGSTSRNVKAIFEHARTVAIRVSGGSDTIHQRHLLAALLNPPGRKGQFNAHKRLKEIGLDRPDFLGELLEFIRASNLREDLDEWAAILRGARQPKPRTKARTTTKTKVDVIPFVAGPAGYTAEFVGVGGERAVADYLFVGTHADRLAELIALRETKLPLAIGLFGNWGSGKSHFMNLIDRRLKGLMDVEKNRPASSSPKWCREIVPIYFNAWHYLDANLWASLVAQIFESLFAHLRPKQDDLAAVQKLLEEASGATARAAEEVGIAQAATEQAKIDLSVAEANRRREETVVDALLRSLEQLLPIPAEELQHQIADVLGGQRAVETLNDLTQVSRDARTFGIRVKRSWNNLFKQPGRNWRLTWLVVTLLIIPSVGLFAATYLPVVKDWFAGSLRGVGPIIAALPPIIGWIAYILKKGNAQLRRIDGWIAQARAAQQRASETPQVMEARMNVTAAIAREEAARSRLAQSEAREQQLIEEARGLHPERRLGRYIEQRAQSSDYRGQLGLVSLARRDFQELSSLFADADALNERTMKLELERMSLEERAASLRKSVAGNEEEEAQQVEEAIQLEKRAKELDEQGKRIERLSASIDRIVLFVDDLDRCQPEKIVEILQAVHLLLAFPLFAVVVGVDQRALRQSLRMQFKGLLTPDSQSEGVKIDINERMATPLDYLEKIFHVPFHLPAMGQEGFAELISKLTEPPKGEQLKAQIEDAPLQIPEVQRFEEKPMSQPALVAPQATPGGEQAKSQQLSSVAQILSEQADVERVAAERVSAEMVGSVPLSEWERKALREYHALIQTPRAAKRLLNTYRLVRAGIPKEEWADFSAGEYRIAMLLLAAAAGYPATAREWFSKLSTSNPEKVLEDKSFVSLDPVAWTQFKNVHKATFSHGIPRLASENTTKWIRRVEAFTF